MPIVLAAPATAPVAGTDLLGLSMSWTGWNGFTVDVGALMGPGVQGLHMPQVDLFQTSTPLVHGTEVTGYSVRERAVYWPMTFRAESSEAWRAEHGNFFDSVHPVEAGTWTVGEGDRARTLDLIGTFDGRTAFNLDPFLFGFAQIGLELLAPRPLWRGIPVVQSFGAVDGVDFIDVGKAPTFHISAAGTFSTASIVNTGDEPAYPVWTVDGPLSTVQLGIGDALIVVPFTVTAGSRLVINTDPTAQFATLNGVDCTQELGFQMFAPVPAKGSTPLTILADGAGAVTVSLTPLYWRAF